MGNQVTAGFSTPDAYNPDRLISGDTDDLVSRKVTLLSGQVLVRGTVVGQITSGGKYIKSLSAAVDGSQTPDGIVAQDADATSGDVEMLVFFGGRFNAHALTLGTAHTIASIREGLRAKGIVLDENPVLAP